jgi:predicted N-acetyltransferase YhbS
LIDWHHQGRGIGRAALRELAASRAAQGETHLLLSCIADVPGSPEPFYRRLGFERTGTINEWGETEMSAPLDRLVAGGGAQTAASRSSSRADQSSST